MSDQEILEEVRAVFRQVEAEGLNNDGPITGCSEKEVRRLEGAIGSRLPYAYVAFLRIGGHSLGGFMAGSALSCEKAFWLTEEANKLLAIYGLALPARAFVFFDHGAYQFAYFLLGGEADPPIFSFHEPEDGEPPAIHKLPMTFTGWLSGAMLGEAKIRRSMR